MTSILLSPEVASAIAERRAVVALESTIFSTLGLPSPANAQALERCLAAVSRIRRCPRGHRGGRRRRPRRARAIRARAGARRLSQGRRPRLARRGRAGLVVRRDDGVGVARARCEGGRRRVRHRGHRRGAPRRRGHGRRQRRPRRARRAPHRDGVRGRQGLPRPRPHARAPRDARRARPRLRHRRAAGVLDAVERAAARAPRRHPLRGRGRRDRCVGARLLTVASSSTVPIPEADALPSELIDGRRSLPPSDEAPVGDHRSGGDARSCSLASAEATEGRSLPANLALAEHNAWIAAQIAVALAGRWSERPPQRRRRKPFHRLSSSSRP